jgi:hypothetical protein
VITLTPRALLGFDAGRFPGWFQEQLVRDDASKLPIAQSRLKSWARLFTCKGYSHIGSCCMYLVSSRENRVSSRVSHCGVPLTNSEVGLPTRRSCAFRDEFVAGDYEQRDLVWISSEHKLQTLRGSGGTAWTTLRIAVMAEGQLWSQTTAQFDSNCDTTCECSKVELTELCTSKELPPPLVRQGGRGHDASAEQVQVQRLWTGSSF